MRNLPKSNIEILEFIPDAIVIVNSDGRIILVNSQTEKVFGYSRDELIGKPVEILVPERLRDLHVGHRQDYYSKPCPRPMGRCSDIVCLRKDGSEFPADISLSPIETEEGFLVISDIRDITERKRNEKALEDSEKKYRDLADNAIVGIYQSTLKGDILYVNDALARMYGFESPDDMISGGALLRYKNPKDRGNLMENLKKDGKVTDLELEMLTAKGETKNFLVSATLNGEVLSGMVIDITGRKRAEEEIKKLNEDLERRVIERTNELAATNKELEAFSYSVSHDLRSPLRSIDGFSQALLEDYMDKLNDQGKDFLVRIRAATKRMTQLIDDMLNLSRVTRSEIHREKVDLSALVNAIASDLRKIQPERKVEFVIAPGLVTHGDARLLRIALENLLGNSWKFTGRRPEAKIEFGAVEQQGRPAYFVRDNGAGFDMAYAGKLFGAFQRLHNMTEFPGTGIGLATVQRIIHRHGGDVWAEGKVEQGATLYFTLSLT